MDNLKAKRKLFGAFCIRPVVRFDTQGEKEEVVLLLRAHPVTQISWIFNSFILFIFLIITNFFLPVILSPGRIIFVDVFGGAIIFSYIWFNFINWYFNVGIVTTEQILDVDFYIVLYKQVTTANLNKIQDLTAKAGGFFESFFNYGNVFAQTAGTEANIEFVNVPDSQDVVKIIDQLVDNAK